MNYKWCWIFLFAFAKAYCQQHTTTQNTSSKLKAHNFEASYLHGTILEHNPDIAHLITDHPTGLMLRWNRKTYGDQDWHAAYSYPDYGVTVAYQDMKNLFLGEAYGVYGHLNFYFFKRNFQLGLGQGFAYMTRPFDLESNPRNNAYGSRITSSTMLSGNFKRERLLGNWGLQAGFNIIHYSNANVKAPNNSTNTFLLTAGINYTIATQQDLEYLPYNKKRVREPIHFNAVLRAGYNESDFRGSGQFPFYDFSFYVDKRIGLKSSLHAGTELFLSYFLREFRDYQANSFPNSGIDGDEDFKRVGIFIGHELHFSKISFITQVGYYVYRPVPFGNKVYNRVGLQYVYNDKILATVSLRSHGASAEGVSLGLGYRL